MVGKRKNQVREALADAVTVTQQVGPFVAELRYPRGVGAELPWSIELQPFPYLPAEELHGGITGSLLRQVDLAAAADERRRIEGGAVDSYVMDEQEAAQRLQSLRMGDDYLAWLAYYYVVLVSTGEPSITAKLGELTGKSAATMTDHLKKCRKAGMLTTVRGRAGGQLTEQARELLANG